LHDLLLMEVPDLILFEYYLPDTKGNYLLAELSDNSDRIWVPTVMSSARCPDAVIIDAYRRGLHSFVNKQGLNCETLSAAISTANDKVYRMKIFNEDKLFSTMNTA
jgi:DNA-binding NarL/FixJ family response regulator